MPSRSGDEDQATAQQVPRKENDDRKHEVDIVTKVAELSAHCRHCVLQYSHIYTTSRAFLEAQNVHHPTQPVFSGRMNHLSASQRPGHVNEPVRRSILTPLTHRTQPHPSCRSCKSCSARRIAPTTLVIATALEQAQSISRYFYPHISPHCTHHTRTAPTIAEGVLIPTRPFPPRATCSNLAEYVSALASTYQPREIQRPSGACRVKPATS
jgi:hypothetical protein